MTYFASESHSCLIETLTPRGEGAVVIGDETFAVPFVLPGDRVNVEVYHKTRKVRALKVCDVQPGPALRTVPACKHFGTCGGCLLQHFTEGHYKSFKKNLVTDALAAVGLGDISVADPLIVGEKKRRRIDFMARLWDGEVRMGFHEATSKKPFNIEECPILEPDIEALFEPLRNLLPSILARERLLHFFVTRAQNGLDFLMAGLKEPMTPKEEEAFIEFAAHHPFMRLAYKVKKKERVLVDHGTPTVRFGRHDVPVTAFGFLQATQASDALFADFLSTHLKSSHPLRIADLFCGRGTLSLALTSLGHHVVGVECDGQALRALQTVPEPLLTIQERNLFEDPLPADELSTFDAIVMNPPRAGAEDQTQHVAQSTVHRVVYISCNAQTFARDCRVLVDAGFTVHHLVPVDQFLWTPHIEVMAYLTRG